MRPYQTECLHAICPGFGKGSKQLVVMPTGTGKTVVFAEAINRHPHDKVMVIAHRNELINQAHTKIIGVTGQMPTVEKADRWSSWDSHVVVSSVQTLNSKPKGIKFTTQGLESFDGRRMCRFDPNQFGLIIIDEAHHAPAKTYRRVIDHFTQNPRCDILGVTATPDRKDQKAMGQVEAEVAGWTTMRRRTNDGPRSPEPASLTCT